MMRVMRLGVALALGVGLALVSSASLSGDDTKTPAKDDTKTTPTKAPDFSKYVYVNEVIGEVVKADEKAVTLRLTSFVPGKPNPNPEAPPPAPVKVTKDFDYHFIPDLSLVRFENAGLLPAKTDDKGKKVAYTQKEKDALKMPTGVVGYAATNADLVAGSTVKVILIRDKSIPASKATDDDSRVKYAVIMSAPVKKN